MSIDPLATPCLLYCGSCRYYMTEECKGCGSEDRKGCKIFDCCKTDRKLHFCTECGDSMSHIEEIGRSSPRLVRRPSKAFT